MTRNLLAIGLLLSLLSGCITTLPEYMAAQQWKGRDAKEAIDFFGTPERMQPSDDRSQVQMQWYRDTSYVKREMIGNSSEMQDGVRVNTNYWEDIARARVCTVSMTVDKARKIKDFSISGRCTGVALAPE
ncbi:hypothetical protein ACA087_07880 [Pseudomonas chlororaphis]|uniref:hypothetical protein n=1 Tax=Pseudomonas chlororaphis TaxID=587753 RepID=UPI00352A9B03